VFTVIDQAALVTLIARLNDLGIRVGQVLPQGAAIASYDEAKETLP
jgi:hypothetical protein